MCASVGVYVRILRFRVPGDLQIPQTDRVFFTGVGDFGEVPVEALHDRLRAQGLDVRAAIPDALARQLVDQVRGRPVLPRSRMNVENLDPRLQEVQPGLSECEPLG